MPLQSGEAEVLLDIGKALDLCFERGLYQLSLNYQVPAPPPAFDSVVQDWIRDIVKE